MKRVMIWVLGVMASLVTSLAFANATAITINGNVSAQMGAGGVRVVRQGDTLRAGDTVNTSAGSSAVLRFEDGQIAVLGANSRMVIQRYEYNAPARSGNIVLNLLSGGMRAITGFIGRAAPQNVAYKAGNYTIGIRGTDVNIATDQGNVAVTVNEGSITFTIGNQTYTVSAGDGAFIRTDGSVRTDVISAIVQYVQANAPTLNQILQNTASVPVSVTVPGPGAGTPGETVTGTITSTPSGPTSTGGGGTASRR